MDTNFDSLANKFSHNIYHTTKGRLRLDILQREFSQYLLPRFEQESLRLLDAGGGQGQMACWLAQKGHQVDFCDVSEQMLTMAKALASEHQVAEQFEFHQLKAQQIGATLGRKYSLICFHAVLEWLAEPREGLLTLLESLEQGGVMSLMFYNYYGLEMHHAVNGNYQYMLKGMPKKHHNTIIPQGRFKPEEVEQWLVEAGYKVERRIGLRVLHDYVKDKNLQEKCYDRLLELEWQRCAHPVYRDLGRYSHFTVSR
ncbi:methyltransferase [Paraferrimonas sedimenticola]|nr:methyltransferase domain-containing protein [Paraferrimonas sedimenticola]